LNTQDPLQWRVLPLAISLACATLLFGSFFLPGTAPLWQVLDVHVAFALNSLVTDSHAQQLLWAFGNLRLFDYIAAVVMLLLVVHYVLRDTRHAPAERAARAGLVCLSLLLLIGIVRDLILAHLDLQRTSPSLVLEPFTRLDQVINPGAKSSSDESFPGDHGTVVAIYVYLMWACAGRRYGVAALAIAMLVCLPRLVAGAHWLTDNIVGGGGIALLAVPWITFTSLGPWVVARITPLLAAAGMRTRQAGRRYSRRPDS